MSETLHIEGTETSQEEKFLWGLWRRFPREERPSLTPEKERAEAMGMAVAYRYADDLIGKKARLGEATIKGIHGRICQFRDQIYPLYEDEGLARPIASIYVIGEKVIKGPFPFQSVSPREFYPKLEELVRVFKRATKPAASLKDIPKKIKEAADVNRRLMHLHPFIDGNGRTAVVLTDMVLMASSLPQIPFWFPKEEFYRTVSESVKKGPEPMEEFLATRVFWGLQAQLIGLKQNLDLKRQAIQTGDWERIENQMAVLSRHYGLKT